MRQLQPVLWTKGLILSPQHLQTQDRFFEDHLGFQLAALSPWLWGFQRLALDPDALGKGELIVAEASGALPDGAVFDVPDSDGHVPPRSVEAAWEPDQVTLTVYLALPEARSDGRNVAMLGEEAGTRFVADVVKRRDENTGLAERELQVARKNLRLLFENEPVEGHSILPITRLLRSDSGQIQEDPAFIPPLLTTSASRRLQSLAERLVELVAARAARLSALRRQRSGSLAHFSVSDVANFWLLYTLNSYLPVLRHLADRRVGHPAELFESMLGLAGSLTTFSTTLDSRDLPAYNHMDPGPGFLRLEAILPELIEKAVPENCVALSLRAVDQTTYAVSLDDDRLLRPLGAYLSVRSDLPASDVIRLAPQLLKVSSSDRVPELIRLGLSGARLLHVANPPSAVPLRQGSQYFEIARSGPEWDSIMHARNLATHSPSDMGNVALELIVLLPERV
jgi:type VI secretion system protein ImpJ